MKIENGNTILSSDVYWEDEKGGWGLNEIDVVENEDGTFSRWWEEFTVTSNEYFKTREEAENADTLTFVIYNYYFEFETVVMHKKQYKQ